MIVRYPVEKWTESVGFDVDFSKHPVKKSYYQLFDGKHPGVDFLLDEGGEVYSSISGIVMRREFHKGMGNVIGIRNGNIVCLYAHLKEFKVQLGQIVEQGGLVGVSGNTGGATLEPHLHFEMRNITRSSLKEMVFDPPFSRKLDNYKEVFEYTVSNQNTKKTLKSLSVRYYGTEKYVDKMIGQNKLLDNNPEDIIPDGTTLQIPNF